MKPYYEDGLVTIYHGDCREWMPEADVVVTDPPYGIDFAGQPTKWQRRAGQEPEAWDVPFEDIGSIVDAAPVVCIWGANYYALPVSRGWLAWIKPDAPPSMGSIEFAWTNLDRNARHIVYSIGATNAERVGHPTQKPLAVMRWTVAGMPEGTVLDPFMGSGSTLVAAKSLGRKSIGIEIEERYCEIAATRCSQEVLGLVPFRCVMVGCHITEKHEHGDGLPMREGRPEDVCRTCGFARYGHRRHHPFVLGLVG
jgi:site-specific DNA-methyltransferase (adenine-specific)